MHNITLVEAALGPALGGNGVAHQGGDAGFLKSPDFLAVVLAGIGQHSAALRHRSDVSAVARSREQVFLDGGRVSMSTTARP